MSESVTYVAAVKQLALEKGLNEATVFEIIESAIAAAYRKDYGRPGQHIAAKIEPKNGAIKIWRVHKAVKTEEEIENPAVDLLLPDAKKLKKGVKAGEEIEVPLPFKEDFGRIAAQTAKQVIIQRIREAEREILYNEFKEKEHQIVNAAVQQNEGRTVIVSLGKTSGVLLPSGQVPGEPYGVGRRMRVIVQEVEETIRGPRIIVSRSSADFIKQLFALEVPEIANGTVDIKNAAREPGSRTKVAVWSDDDNIDPVGSAVGQRGARVQAVLSELCEEKVDIILYDEDAKTYIASALSPAKVTKITLRKGDKRAKVEIPEDQLSLAIGRHGQNVRLASRLTGWELDIVESGTVKETPASQVEKEAPTPQEEAEEAKIQPKTSEKKDTAKSPAKTKKSTAKPKVKKTVKKKATAPKKLDTK